MSDIVVPNSGERRLLRQLTLYWSGLSPVFRVFVNDLTPDEDTVLGDLVEATWSGYEPLSVSAWSDPATDAGQAVTTAPLIEWTYDGGGPAESAYGVYATDDEGELLWLQRDPDAPWLMDTQGQAYRYTPRFSLKSQS